MMDRFAREPLLQFFVAGAILFALSEWLESQPSLDQITITVAEQRNLAALHGRTWGRPPTDQELRGLIARRVRQEVLAREAIAQGLDDGDPVVRARLAQKFEFLADDMTAAMAPSDAELAEFLEARADDYAIQAQFTFEQIFFRDASDERLSQALTTLSEEGTSNALGDGSDLPARMYDATLAGVGQIFGDRFANSLDGIEIGEWSGPVASVYGSHLVRISKRSEPRPATLDDVREAVERDWREVQRTALNDALYDELRKNYDIVIEGQAP